MAEEFFPKDYSRIMDELEAQLPSFLHIHAFVKFQREGKYGEGARLRLFRYTDGHENDGVDSSPKQRIAWWAMKITGLTK